MHVISSYIHLSAYRYFICFTHYKRTILYFYKFINVIYSLHLLHTLSINSFEHSFLLEMIHFKCYLFYLFFPNSFVIYSSIHNKRKFQVRLVIFHTSTTGSWRWESLIKFLIPLGSIKIVCKLKGMFSKVLPLILS